MGAAASHLRAMSSMSCPSPSPQTCYVITADASLDANGCTKLGGLLIPFLTVHLRTVRCARPLSPFIALLSSCSDGRSPREVCCTYVLIRSVLTVAISKAALRGCCPGLGFSPGVHAGGKLHPPGDSAMSDGSSEPNLDVMRGQTR